MARKKKQEQEFTSGAAGGGTVQAKVQTVAVPPLKGLFPVKPARKPNEKPPGTIVRLISNLFRMSVTQNKPIYKVTVTVSVVQESDDEPASEKSDKVPAKIGNEYRRLAVNKAISDWISKNSPKDLPPKNVGYSFVFDTNGSIIYSLFNLFPPSIKTGDKQEFVVSLQLERIEEKKLGLRERSFKVIFHNGNKLDLKLLFDYCAKKNNADNQEVQEQLKAMNVIMRSQISTIPHMVLTQFNVFPYTKDNQFYAGPGVLINKGFSTSVRPAECGVILNVANTIGAFHEEIDLIDLVRSKYRNVDLSKGLHDDVREWLKKEIFNKQIEATHINYGTPARPHYRRYRVTDIGSSGLDKFTLVDKKTKKTREITIAQYFKEEYKLTLKYPNLPCVIDKGRKIPLEVCHLIDKQKITRKMDPDETATIIKETAMKPEIHFQQVKKNVKLVKANCGPLNDFGLDFTPQEIEVDGRELAPISLSGGEGRTVQPSDGQYIPKFIGFFKPARVNKWALAFLMDGDVKRDKARNGSNELFGHQFSVKYCQEARNKGVTIRPLTNDNINYIDVEVTEQQLKNILVNYFKHLNETKVDHCIIVLPKRCPDWMYRYLQYLEASTQKGRKANENWTRTSCVKYQNYVVKILNSKDDGRMFISNLWLKYNTKLGGINFILNRDSVTPSQYPFLADDYIFISVDVCHPAPGDKLIQSVAAVVGMWDITNKNLSYCTRLRVQKKQRDDHSTIEHVGEINIMFEEVLESYRLKKKTLPRKIVVLRDGVSEGQFRIVLNYELGRVKNSLNNLYKNYKLDAPLLTCLVVQKRHKVRFMRKVPISGRRGQDYNIQPGTVVDSVVTHPTDFSFYLAPHKAIQGTSRAPHIYIICDEIKFTQDQAQAMVHALSYLSPRCTKSTSIPTPVNLADLAAEQGKNLVISWNDANMAKMTPEDRLKNLNLFLSNLAEENYKNTLYYI